MAKIALLGDLDKTSPLHKIRSRHDLNMVGTLFESLGFIVAQKIIFMKFLRFLYLFVTKTVLFRLGKFENLSIPFWLQKSTKKCRNFIKVSFSAIMESELSNDVPTMFRSCLDRILRTGEVWSKSLKSVILAILVKIDRGS